MTVAFSQKAHDLSDEFGKQAVIKFFERREYITHYDGESLGIDLQFSKEGYPDIFVEVAVRKWFSWKLSEWDKHAPWGTVHILNRKRKYGKPEPQWYGRHAYLFELNHDATEAFVIRASDLKDEWLKEVMTRRGYHELMFDVPVEEFVLFDLTK